MKKSPKQIAAILCIILLVLLYAATLLVALLDFPGSDRLFAACLMATIGLPILLWIYLWLYGKYTGRRTAADASLEAISDTADEEAADGQPSDQES